MLCEREESKPEAVDFANINTCSFCNLTATFTEGWHCKAEVQWKWKTGDGGTWLLTDCHLYLQSGVPFAVVFVLFVWLIEKGFSYVSQTRLKLLGSRDLASTSWIAGTTVFLVLYLYTFWFSFVVVVFWVLFCFVFWLFLEILTQPLTIVREVLFHLNHAPRPFLL
jgi:hypothetical protein